MGNSYEKLKLPFNGIPKMDLDPEWLVGKSIVEVNQEGEDLSLSFKVRAMAVGEYGPGVETVMALSTKKRNMSFLLTRQIDNKVILSMVTSGVPVDFRLGEVPTPVARIFLKYWELLIGCVEGVRYQIGIEDVTDHVDPCSLMDIVDTGELDGLTDEEYDAVEGIVEEVCNSSLYVVKIGTLVNISLVY